MIDHAYYRTCRMVPGPVAIVRGSVDEWIGNRRGGRRASVSVVVPFFASLSN